MTNQEIFDLVVPAIIKQGRPSRSETPVFNKDGEMTNGCRYRSEDGAKCAIGMLITDEEYAMYGAEIEDNKASEAISYIPRLNLWLAEPVEGFDKRFLDELQRAHDNALSQENYPSVFINNFKRRCRNVALDFDLDDDVAK